MARILLLYPPEQNWPGTLCKPNGSLAYPMLGGALREVGHEVEVYDACVGNADDDVGDVFFQSKLLPSGMVRTGVEDARILAKASDADIIGLTSIFSHQETMVLRCVRLIKQAYPDKLIIVGGVNARHRMQYFYDAGVDLICTSEAERTVVDIARAWEKQRGDYRDIAFIAYRGNEGFVQGKQHGEIIWDLDDLPIPAWDLLPNERYWEIGRPHGGHFKEGDELKYASMMTSLGCPFHCSYCHIAKETKGSEAGEIGRFRIKSDERVIEELRVLKEEVGVRQVFVEDDSIFGHKRRAIRLLRKIKGIGLDILDVNGVNIIHLLKKGQPDIELIELLAEVGFIDIVLPFESAHQRIITRWCSNKWQVNNIDVEGLVKVIKATGMRVAANYMIGFPDESREEINTTIEFAQRNMDYGLDATNFFLCMPLPGTPMFEHCIANGQLPRDFNIDKMQWTRANMVNTPVPPEELEEIRQHAWELANRPEHKANRRKMAVSGVADEE